MRRRGTVLCVVFVAAAAVGVVLSAGGCSDEPAERPKPTETAEAAKPAPEQLAFANTTCPIMGSKIYPAKVTDALMRDFEGKKVAFCCGACPVQWDELTAEQKRAKLLAAK